MAASSQSTTPTPPPPNVTLLPQTPQSPAASVAASVDSPAPVPEPSATPGAAAAAAATITITVPSCSAWFAFEKIDATEIRCLPEFFEGNSKVRTPKTYKYFRDSIIRQFRSNPSRKITCTEARRGLVGDVGSCRKVFDFLESWGLINYVPPARKEKKEQSDDAAATVEKKDVVKRVCSSCKSVCSMACFVTDKVDIVLCARCFVRGGYRHGLSNHDFRRVDISEETRSDWTDKETLHLLEALLQYGEDWKKVAEHVGTRNEKECVGRFIKLTFGEQFLVPPEHSYDVKDIQTEDDLNSTENKEDVAEQLLKRRRFNPLSDASNPIMAQVAVLSAMVGSEVAEAAAQAAISSLHEVKLSSFAKVESLVDDAKDEDSITETVFPTAQAYKEAVEEAESQLEKERQAVQQSMSDIIDVEMKEIQEKIINFEELEYQIQKERVQLTHMKHLLFADQLTLLQQQKSRSGNALKVVTSNGFT